MRTGEGIGTRRCLRPLPRTTTNGSGCDKLPPCGPVERACSFSALRCPTLARSRSSLGLILRTHRGLHGGARCHEAAE